MKHGEERVRRVPVGRTSYLKREKFCQQHGWFDSVLFPNFDEQHAPCRAVTGADIYDGLPEAEEKPFGDLSPANQFIFNLFAETANEVLAEEGVE